MKYTNLDKEKNIKKSAKILGEFLIDNLIKIPNFNTQDDIIWKTSLNTPQGKLHSICFTDKDKWKEISQLE